MNIFPIFTDITDVSILLLYFSTTMESKNDINIRQIIEDYFPETSWKVRKMILNTQKNSQGEAKIYIEVLKYEYAGTGKYKKKEIRISTEIWVLPQNWSKKKRP